VHEDSSECGSELDEPERSREDPACTVVPECETMMKKAWRLR